MKTKNWLSIIALLSSIFIFGAFAIDKNENQDWSKQEILLRKIGHEVLLQAGNQKARVLPIKKLSENEFQIKFEEQFTFKTDSLVKIVRRSLANNSVSEDYIVNVVKCATDEVIYGYMIFSDKKNDVIPCRGRIQPKDCYLINIKFENIPILPAKHRYLISGLGLITSCSLLFGLIYIRSRKKILPDKENQLIPIGKTLFDSEKRTLLLDQTITTLTSKESKILLIFSTAQNQMIEKSRLQKEIWEDEGVIVGRSLDMFISKLRRKLADDKTISLINVHGKGYKLTVISEEELS